MYSIRTAHGLQSFDSPAAIQAAVRSGQIFEKQIVTAADGSRTTVQKFLAAQSAASVSSDPASPSKAHRFRPLGTDGNPSRNEQGGPPATDSRVVLHPKETARSRRSRARNNVLFGGAYIAGSFLWLHLIGANGQMLFYLACFVLFGCVIMMRGIFALDIPLLSRWRASAFAARLEQRGNPWHSQVAGWGVHVAGLALLVLGASLLIRVAFPRGHGLLSADVVLGLMTVAVAALFSGPLLISNGRRLRTRTYRDVVSNDHRAPILFLRSFQDDGRAAGELGVFDRTKKDSLWDAVLTLGVFDVWRFVSGTGNLSLEEELADYFKEYGPFVAIGKPGEHLQTLGAARVYVDNQLWQDKVRSLMDASQLIIWQAGSTEGTWWELSELTSHVAPGKIVLITPPKFLAPAAGHPPDSVNPSHRDFLARANAILPKPIASLNEERFIVFENDWTPRALPMLLRSTLGRRLHRGVLDLRASLAPVRDRLRTITGATLLLEASGKV